MNKASLTLLLFVFSILCYADEGTNILNPKSHFSLFSGFVENKGQIIDQHSNTNKDVFYFLKGSGFNVQLKQNGISYEVVKKVSKPNTETVSSLNRPLKSKKIQNELKFFVHRVDINFLGSNPNAEISEHEPLSCFLNYYTSKTSEEGTSNIKIYKKIIYKDIYPNIDIEFIVTDPSIGGKFKYNFIVNPGGNINNIKLQIEGANSLSLSTKGHIIMKTAYGNIDESIPYSYQLGKQNHQISVEAKFIQLKNNEFGIKVDNYNSKQPLVIDPSPWSTYYGGTDIDEGYGIANDTAGNVFITGVTTSSSSIATSGAYQTTFGGDYDAFIAKYNSHGVLQWSTYFGGTSFDFGYYIATDLSGNPVITGLTNSTSGIVSSSPHQSTLGGGGGDGFILKLNTSGVRQWSTYFGGTDYDYGYYIATDLNGNIVITGSTYSGTQIATSGSHQSSRGGNGDAFVAKFNASGTLQWGTYYGGGNVDDGNAVAIDTSGNIFLAGNTSSTSGISSSGSYQSSLKGTIDGFAVKFNKTGARQWSTYYGGDSQDGLTSVAVDIGGNPSLIGYTNSRKGFNLNGSYQDSLGGKDDCFLVRFNKSGSRLWGTYYGGGSYDYGYGITIDKQNYISITGETSSTDSIATSGSYQSTFGGTIDAFVAKFNNQGVRQWSTYYGGVSEDYGFSISTDNKENILLTGLTSSKSEIATIGSYQSSYSGGTGDVFIASFPKNGKLLQIFNNIISGYQTFCAGAKSSTITGSMPSGGFNKYTFTWLSSTSDSVSGFTSASGKNDSINYSPGILTQTTWLKRLVISGSIKDTSKVVKISVNPRAIVGFSVDKAAQCFRNNNYLFTDTTKIISGSFKRSWTFGDGDTSSIKKINKSYKNSGSYAVKLAIVSNFGCKDSTFKTVQTYIQASNGFTINKDTQCLNKNKFLFSDTTTNKGGSFKRFWTFGNGDTSSQVQVSKTYSKASQYKIKLVSITNNGCIDSTVKYVKVLEQPQAAFSVNDTSQCFKINSFQFADISTIASGTLKRNWTFGNGDTSTITKPKKSYSKSNTFRVTLVSYGTVGCKDSLSKYIYVNPEPSIGFTINKTNQCLNSNKFIFSDTSKIQTGTLKRLWNFGDGDTSTLVNLNKTYANANAYKVKLISFSNSGCKDSIIKSVNVESQPKVNFTINDSTQCFKNNYFFFTDISTSSLGAIKRIWTFGDGDTSTIAKPNKKYSKANTYNVKLVVSGTAGCKDSLTITVFVYHEPLVGFTINKDTQCLNNNHFLIADTSQIGSGTFKRFWSFGDSDTSSSKKHDKSYAKAGSFKVRLLIKSDAGCIDSVSKMVIVNPQPKAAFTINDTSQCNNINRFLFTDISTSSIGTLKRKWFFGDGDTSTNIKPSKTYALSKTYSVQLVSIGLNGCTDSLSKKVSVNPQPLLAFIINNSTQCLKLNLFQFTDQTTISSGSLKRLWRFGDGDTSTLIKPSKKYTKSNNFSVILTSFSSFGCKDSLSKIISVYPQPTAGFSINDSTQCLKNNLFQFTDISTISSGTLKRLWALGENDTSTNKNPSKFYSKFNTYKIKLTSISNFGCSDSISKSIFTYPQSSGFSINTPNQCLSGNNFIFNDTSSARNSTTQRNWNFGDGTKSNITNPTKKYNNPGAYVVKFVSNNAFGCKDSTTKSVFVYPQPSAGFSVNAPSQCFNSNNFVFKDSSTISSGTFQRLWSFGDGNKTQLLNPTKTYGSPNTYEVKLFLSSNYNCKDSLIKYVTVNVQPTVGFTLNNSSQCLSGNKYILNDTSHIANGSLSRIWYWGDGSFSTSKQGTKSYTKVGNYKIKLITSSDAGCKDSVSSQVDVNPHPTVDFSINNAEQCLRNNNFIFTDSSTISNGTLTRIWTFGDTSTSALSSVTKTFKSAKTYSVKLLVTTNWGCANLNSESVIVNTSPVIGSIQGPQTVSNTLIISKYYIKKQAGHTYFWTAVGGKIISGQTSDTVTVQWSGAGHLKAQILNYYGCSDTTSINVIVNSVGINKILPNSIYLSPNPANNHLNIASDKAIEDIKCLNFLGQTCEISIENNVIDISKLSEGIYFLSVMTDGKKNIVLKFIKSKE